MTAAKHASLGNFASRQKQSAPAAAPIRVWRGKHGFVAEASGLHNCLVASNTKLGAIERAMAVRDAAAQLSELFTMLSAVEVWLNTPAVGLGGKTPIAVICTAGGSARVQSLISSIIHGVPR